MTEEQPKLLSYCTLVYDALDREATTTIVGEGTDEVRVWRGHITKLLDKLDIPKGSWTRVTDALRQLGCIERVERGYRGTARSVYVLRTPPTAHLFAEKISARPLTSSPSSDTLAASVRDLQLQIGGMNIVEAFSNIENRIKVLERKVEQLSSNPNQ